jgi:hypothetical protein
VVNAEGRLILLKKDIAVKIIRYGVRTVIEMNRR